MFFKTFFFSCIFLWNYDFFRCMCDIRSIVMLIFSKCLIN